MKNLLAVTKESLLKENLLAVTEEVAELIVEQSSDPDDLRFQGTKTTGMRAAGSRLERKKKDAKDKVGFALKQITVQEKEAIALAQQGKIKEAVKLFGNTVGRWQGVIAFARKNADKAGVTSLTGFMKESQKNLKNLTTADVFFNKGKLENDPARKKAFIARALKIFPQHGLAQKEIKALGVTKDPRSVSGTKPDPAAAAAAKPAAAAPAAKPAAAAPAAKPAAKKAEPAKPKGPLAAVPIFNYDIQKTGKFQGQRLEIWGTRNDFFYNEPSGYKRRGSPPSDPKKPAAGPGARPYREAKEVLSEVKLNLNDFMKNFKVDSWSAYKQVNKEDLATGNVKPIHLHFFIKEFYKNLTKDSFKKVDITKLNDQGKKVADAIIKARTNLAKFLNAEYTRLAINQTTIAAALTSGGGKPKLPVVKGDILFVPNSAFAKGPEAGGAVSYFTTAEATLAKRLGLATSKKGTAALTPTGTEPEAVGSTERDPEGAVTSPEVAKVSKKKPAETWKFTNCDDVNRPKGIPVGTKGKDNPALNNKWEYNVKGTKAFKIVSADDSAISEEEAWKTACRELQNRLKSKARPPESPGGESAAAEPTAKKKESQDLKDIKKTESETQKARKLKKLVNKMAPRFIGREEKGWKTPRTERFNELEWKSARRSLGRKDYEEVIKLIEMAENRTAKQFGKELEELSRMRIGQDFPIPPFLVKHTFRTKPKMRKNFPGVDLNDEESLKGWLISYEDGDFLLGRERAYKD